MNTRRTPARTLVALVCALAMILATGAPATARPDEGQREPGIAYRDGVSRQRDPSAPLAQAFPGTGDVSPAAAEGVFSSSFETGFGWLVSGSPQWAMTSYRASDGTYSVYCAGSTIAPPGPYAANMDTWLVAGPYNLVGYTSATLTFDLWANTEYDPDYWTDFVFAGASTDGVNFTGAQWDGNTGGWVGRSVDVSAYCGQANVYVGFEFVSDESIQLEGVYLDKVEMLADRSAGTSPVAVADTFNLQSGKQGSIAPPGVLANDYCPDGPTTWPQVVTTTYHGTLNLNPDGGIVWTPWDLTFIGVDSFTYRLWDGDSYSDTVTVTLNIMENIPPIPGNDSYMVVKDTPKFGCPPGVLANDRDPEGSILIATNASDPPHGSVEVWLGGSFEYTPDPGYTGPDSFTYRCSDGGAYALATVYLNVVESSPVSVYRFYNARAGTHFYTADPNECANVMANLANVYTFEGVAYTVTPASNEIPLYRFYRPRSGTHFYTADPVERDRVIATLGASYTYEGVAYSVMGHSNAGVRSSGYWWSGWPAVYRFYRPSTGTHFYTADPAERDRILTTPSLRSLYSYDGPAFYLGQ